MKRLRWTAHVLQALVARDIDRAEVEQTIAAPDHLVSDSPRRVLLMRRYFDNSLQRQMLLRVVIEDTTDERVVITAYKTSQFTKYLKRIKP